MICLLIAAGSSAVFSACRGATFIVIGGRLAERLRCALGDNRHGRKGDNAQPFLTQIKICIDFELLPKKNRINVVLEFKKKTFQKWLRASPGMVPTPFWSFTSPP